MPLIENLSRYGIEGLQKFSTPEESFFLPDSIVQTIAIMPLSTMENTTFVMPSIIDSHDMGLRTVLQSGCPKENAYSTPEESFFHLFLCVIGKAANLSDFDRGQIVMARRLGTNISEIARLVGCSRSTVFSTYAKWMNNGETSSR
ncbi:HTH_Tnp_Tc3_2 domain-containing protein [Trichonephila clavipes]|nr:HTH_Tnp_Tc3_2 domain-containing protein [Trichonephila clavipes]